SDDDLSALMDELVQSDPGRDVERVVGLAGSVPRYEIAFHELGLGKLFGKHLITRAMNDAREYESIERGFSYLSEQERAKLYGSRKRHKTAAVFLHELGHTLGAPHELDARWLMHASYDPKEEGYSPGTAELMRLVLERELDPATQT